MSKIITFTGGFGAQLMSAAGYFYLNKLHSENNNSDIVGAYLGYFNNQPHLATPGITGDMSHWKWELGCYGIQASDFIQLQGSPNDYIWDSHEKIQLGWSGLCDPEISRRFPIMEDVTKYRNSMFGDGSYGCIHIRRGDYVNVASFMVADEAFVRVTTNICKLIKNLLVVSDSPLSTMMISFFQTLPTNTIVAIGGPPHLVHGLMRLSDILICSNSQYSMTAAALRDKFHLTIYPSQHDEDPGSYSNLFLTSIREFQVITKI